MRSLAEYLAEKVGYALAAVILGPPAAMARRERRAMRTALDSWCEEVGAIRVEAARRERRYSGKLEGAAGSFPFEVTLDAFHTLAVLDVAIEKLPPQADVTISKPRGREVSATSSMLDASITSALVAEIAGTPIGARDSFSLALDGERIVLHVSAPHEAAEWKAIGDATVAFAESCARRWGSSYR